MITSTRWHSPIEKVTVTAKSRALKAEYSLELAQDLESNPRIERRSRTCKHPFN